MRRFDILISNRALSIFADGREIVREMRVLLSYTRIHDVLFVPVSVSTDENGDVIASFARAESTVYKEASEVCLRFGEVDGSLCVRLTALGSRYPLLPTNSAKIAFALPEDTDGLVSLYDRDPCWLNVSFEKNMENFSQHTESISAKVGDSHLHLMPLSSEALSARFDASALALHTRVWGQYNIEDVAVLAMSVADDPYTAIKDNITSMYSCGVITSPPVRERRYPKSMEGLGWCTWEAISNKPTPEKIYACMDSFAELGVRLRWVIIDDGWSDCRNKKLSSFKPDSEKFPDGLAPVVSTLKEKYGVEYVGIWCAAHGYWGGIDPDGEIAREHPDWVFKTGGGSIRPGPDREATYKFWDAWFAYLKEQGIDFVKIDVQGSLAAHFDGLYPGSTGCRGQHEGLDAAAEKHFGGAMINCMGATLEDALARPSSSVVRCSGDFMPSKADHFAFHTRQGVYVASLLGEIHYCDFDMFFTRHRWAVPYGVLSAISGGPLYISDKAGESDKAVIGHLALDDGGAPRFDYAARPTLDCFYKDSALCGEALKVFNVSGENIAVAAFGISRGRDAYGRLTLADIPKQYRHAEKYIVHDYMNDRYYKLSRDGYIDFTVPYESAQLFTLYPIDENGEVSIGDGRLYAEGAVKETRRVHYKDLI